MCEPVSTPAGIFTSRRRPSTVKARRLPLNASSRLTSTAAWGSSPWAPLNPTRRRAPPRRGAALPVGAETVVALSLVGVGEDLVGLVDLLEAVGRPLGLGNVWVMLPGQPPIGLLDRPGVGVPGHPRELVVVLVFHHSNCSRTTRPRGAGAAPAL